MCGRVQAGRQVGTAAEHDLEQRDERLADGTKAALLICHQELALVTEIRSVADMLALVEDDKDDRKGEEEAREHHDEAGHVFDHLEEHKDEWAKGGGALQQTAPI